MSYRSRALEKSLTELKSCGQARALLAGVSAIAGKVRITLLTWSLLGWTLLMPTPSWATVKMAITFDDLPAHGSLPPKVTRVEVIKSILATLKSHHVPEVYGFINAGRPEGMPDLDEVLKLWIGGGYPLGNHTFTHVNLNKVGAEKFKKEITTNEDVLRKMSGNTDWHYFRYPYLKEGKDLENRNSVRSFLIQKNYKIAEITDDFEDWAWNSPYARCKTKGDLKEIDVLKKSYIESATERFIQDGKVAEAVFHRSVARILLLHVGAFDAEMLPTLLRMYENKGVQFIPLSEAVRASAYEVDPGISAGVYGGDFQYGVLEAHGMTTKEIGLTSVWQFPGKRLEATCAD